MEKNWKVAFNTTEPYLAEIAQQVLRDNDINSVIMNKKDSSYTVIGYIEVLVEEKNHSAAEELLKEL